MVFSSFAFLLLFMSITVLLHWVLPAKWRNPFLLLVSLIFYAYGEQIYTVVMLVTIGVDYLAGLWIGALEQRPDRQGLRRAVLIGTVILNLGSLCFFKYTNFLLQTFSDVFGYTVSLLKVAMPIGISFYTFQNLSYVLDVYAGRTRAQKNFIRFATYVALFPQLIAGPIVRYVEVEEQLVARRVDPEKMAQGIFRFCVGLAKKVLLANQVGLWASQVQELRSVQDDVLLAWLAALMVTFQIYFDFSGYSDMAIGLGHMLGFDFPENFNYPYEARSITDFWRRWHMTLSGWFREYVYIPLGGNRHGKARQVLNLFLVWFLTGLWHGAGWTFILWGLYFFVLLVLEKFVWGRFLDKAPAFVGHLYALFFIVIGWVIFFAEDLPSLGRWLAALAGAGAGVGTQGLYFALTHALPLLAMAVGSTHLPRLLFGKVKEKCGVRGGFALCALGTVGLLLLSVAFLEADTFNPFLYFRF